jgi:hypothetical protein
MLFAEVVCRVRRAARIVFLSIALGSAGVSSGVSAANVTLAWNPSTDPTVSGYRLYYGLYGGTYTNMVDTGPTTSVTISNLVPGVTYQFAATTYTIAGLESAYSTEISYTVPALGVGPDYLVVGVGSTSVQAGKATVVPVYLTCSDGFTNVSLKVGWPGTNFPNPSLSSLASGLRSGTLQNHGTNLVIALKTATGQTLQGTNLIAQLNFQTVTNQPSAFINLPVAITAANKPNGTAYTNRFPQAGQVAVVNDLPLLQVAPSGNSGLALTLFGKVGTNYQVQCATNLVAPVNWFPLNTYNLTNVAQTLNLNPTNPVVMYRVQQR